MREIRASKIWMGISVGGFLLNSASFLIMPVMDLLYLPGILFWLGLVLGIAGQIAVEHRRKLFFKSYRMNHRKMQKARCGALCAFSNLEAKAADILAVLAAAGLAAVFAVTGGMGYICFAAIALAVFTFCLHCILNGRNYFHIKNFKRVKQTLEQKQGKEGAERK